MYTKYKKELDNLKSQFLFREINDFEKSGKYILCGGKKLLNLSSNDYLGLAENEEIRSKFLSGFKGSLGSASSRLLTGGAKIYTELENLIAELFNKEKALMFNSGYHANTGLICALAGKSDVVFCDKLNHASIIDGIRLAGCGFHRYKHLDYEHLEELLIKHRQKHETALIVTESVFSMDGDIADLGKLAELKEKYNAILVVDEAHAFGVYGENGLGIAQSQNKIDKVDIIVATLGKAAASAGAFICGEKVIIDYVINKARPFIFSTALPEINTAFSKFVIEEIFPTAKPLRENLINTSGRFRSLMSEKKLKVLGSSHIVPIVLGENKLAVDCAKTLRDEGFYLLPIRYPTVARNSARIRFSLRADISFDEIKAAASIETPWLNFVKRSILKTKKNMPNSLSALL